MSEVETAEAKKEEEKTAEGDIKKEDEITGEDSADQHGVKGRRPEAKAALEGFIGRQMPTDLEAQHPETDVLAKEEKETKQSQKEIEARMAKLAGAGAVGSQATGMGLAVRDLGFALSKARANDPRGDGGGKINVKNIAKQAERIHGRTKYSLEDLQNKQIEGVDPDLKEEYLADELFMEVFGMERDEFYKLPVWKKKQLKKGVGLF